MASPERASDGLVPAIQHAFAVRRLECELEDCRASLEAARQELAALRERARVWYEEDGKQVLLDAEEVIGRRQVAALLLGKFKRELAAIDNLLARRDALDDLPDRCDKIARLLRVANEADPKAIIPECERTKTELRAAEASALMLSEALKSAGYVVRASASALKHGGGTGHEIVRLGESSDAIDRALASTAADSERWLASKLRDRDELWCRALTTQDTKVVEAVTAWFNEHRPDGSGQHSPAREAP